MARTEGIFIKPLYLPIHFQNAMICPKCHTPIELPTNFCPHCGVSLQRSGSLILIVTAGLVLSIVIGVYGYVKYRFSERRHTAFVTAARESQQVASASQTGKLRVGAAETPRSWVEPLPVTRADLTLKDITGREFGDYAVTIVSSGWFAFPRRFCIGAVTWQATLGPGGSLPVEGVILQDEDPVGLWQLPVANPLGGLELAPWAPELPLHWHPLDDSRNRRPTPVQTIENLGNFDRIPLGAESAEPGVFIQDGRLVGWSFGELFPGGYLWTGNRGRDLIPEFYTDDFYRLTFEGGREEAFLLALADENLLDFERLTALAKAHQLEARMPQSDVPEYISPPMVHATMRSLIQNLRTQGQAEDVFTLFDTQIVLAVNHPPLTSDLVTAAQDAGEYTYALSLVETLQQAETGKPQQLRELELLQSSLYRDWLIRLLAEGDNANARGVYQEAKNRFPQDPAIHLVGVELTLQKQNWALAERLLAAQRYPPHLRDTVDRLQRGISELKSQEGKIVIRYQPGSRTIQVTARLDRGLDQRFLIDTGASIVTVPSATARRLGIDQFSYKLPRRLFYSATGVHNAIEVTLPYIDLNGWVVQDVKALVVDLPGQPGVGLLGMNYLRNFQMEVNTTDGVLTLEPL